MQSELRYHPFGETRHSDGTTPTTRRFTGQIQDEGTGLYYYNARYYDPAIGRFIQADTIVPEPGNPQALNRYSYVYNNPLKYVDPTGHFTEGEINQYLEHHYGDNWQLYRAAWRHDTVFWAALREAELLDVLTAEADSGIIGHGVFVSSESAPFRFEAKYGNSLLDYQGKGPYSLTRGSKMLISAPSSVNATLFEETVTWRQPLYDYSSGIPVYTLADRVSTYTWQSWNRNLTVGDSVPALAGITVSLIGLTPQGRAAKWLIGFASTSVSLASAVTGANNLTESNYGLTSSFTPGSCYTGRSGYVINCPYLPNVADHGIPSSYNRPWTY